MVIYKRASPIILFPSLLNIFNILILGQFMHSILNDLAFVLGWIVWLGPVQMV